MIYLLGKKIIMQWEMKELKNDPRPKKIATIESKSINRFKNLSNKPFGKRDNTQMDNAN
jgi:hypothetical protein